MMNDRNGPHSGHHRRFDMSRSPLRIVLATAAVGGASALACPPKDSPSTPAEPILLTAVKEPAPEQRHVDLAICLDTSGSMQGLIEAAKTKLWDIVNDLALAKPAPKLRVALLTYGNDGHNAENGWVNIDSAFTEDLDLISQQLFAMTTNGGTELVGRVIKAASEQLEWTPGDDALKLIVVAGNESADQDQQFAFRDVCKATISKGVMINSIYCGNIADDIAPAWKEVSALADGHFAAIDHNHGTVVISTPFDAEIASLSVSLNGTYIPFGAQGQVYAANQQEQDQNAASLGVAVAAQRGGCKAGAVYRCSNWDLVDACKVQTFKLEDIKDEDLPENMRAMTLEQRRAFIAQNDAKRIEIQAKVADLNSKRQQVVDAELKKMTAGSDKSFDLAIRKAIRAQAAAKGFQFEEPKITLKPDDC
jgi:hypothetical protein